MMRLTESDVDASKVKSDHILELSTEGVTKLVKCSAIAADLMKALTTTSKKKQSSALSAEEAAEGEGVPEAETNV